MLVIHRQYDDIVQTASTISFAQSYILKARIAGFIIRGSANFFAFRMYVHNQKFLQVEIIRCSPSISNQPRVVDQKIANSSIQKTFQRSNRSHDQPRNQPRDPGFDHNIIFLEVFFFQNQATLTMVPMTMMLCDAERSCSPQGGQIAQLNSDRCALRHLLLRSLQRAKYNVQVQAKFNVCSIQILKVQCQIQIMMEKQIYRRRCAECSECSLVV